MSIVRENLMTRKGYSPYCGNEQCRFHMPRTRYIGGQFQCGCGWRSSFEDEFIEAYEAKWAEPEITPKLLRNLHLCDPAPVSIETAEANIRADHRAGKITKEQFQKEMLIMARARKQANADPSHLPKEEPR